MNIDQIAAFFEGLLKHVHFVSLALGVCASVGFTQLIKYPLRRHFYQRGLDPQDPMTPEIEVASYLWVVRIIAVASSALVTFLTWPDDGLVERLVWSATGGLMAPGVYAVVTHYVPWLGDKLSADVVKR